MRPSSLCSCSGDGAVPIPYADSNRAVTRVSSHSSRSRRAQRVQRPRADVAEVADGRGNQHKLPPSRLPSRPVASSASVIATPSAVGHRGQYMPSAHSRSLLASTPLAGCVGARLALAACVPVRAGPGVQRPVVRPPAARPPAGTGSAVLLPLTGPQRRAGPGPAEGGATCTRARTVRNSTSARHAGHAGPAPLAAAQAAVAAGMTR